MSQLVQKCQCFGYFAIEYPKGIVVCVYLVTNRRKEEYIVQQDLSSRESCDYRNSCSVRLDCVRDLSGFAART